MKRTAILFSGGKDSTACMYLNQDLWDKDEVYVFWCNTGAAYQSTIDQMAKWKERVKNFIEVRSDQPGQIKKYGYPADVVPVNNTYFAKFLGKERRVNVLIQPYYSCCAANIWFPLGTAMKEYGIEVIINGSRKDDPQRLPVEDGAAFAGFTYVFPLHNWTEEQVFEYLESIDADYPNYYKHEFEGRDCWDCTGWLEKNENRIARLPEERRNIVLQRLQQIEHAVRAESLHAKVLSTNFDRARDQKIRALK